MPRRDGTGPPWGSGPGTGRGLGRGRGGGGKGRMGGRGLGPSGDCVCPNCGAKAPHQPGTPCNVLSCPNCGTRMVRG